MQPRRHPPLLGSRHQHDPQPGVGSHPSLTFSRISRVERHIRRAGIHDGEQSDEQFRGAFERESDAGFGADAEGLEVGGEAAGAAAQMGVGEMGVAIQEGEGVGGAAALTVEEAGEGEVGKGGGGIIPFHQ